ncbi:MAG: DUF1700 domain-containing protein [Methanobacterium sp. ERen5]|nr:MAG: DUF1700 domain-containing protein [Methanobacterium sp. ERen5]
MNKEEYLKKLSKQIKKMSVDEKRDLLLDYEEHFRIGMEKGRTEEEISKALGNPKNVAKQIKADYMVKKAEDKPSPTSIIEALTAVAGLGLFNIFIAVPSLLLAVVIISLVLAGSAVIVIGIFITLSPLLHVFLPNFVYLPVDKGVSTIIWVLFGIALTIAGTIFVLIMSYAANKLYQMVIKLLKSNIEDIKENTMVFK